MHSDSFRIWKMFTYKLFVQLPILWQNTVGLNVSFYCIQYPKLLQAFVLLFADTAKFLSVMRDSYDTFGTSSVPLNKIECNISLHCGKNCTLSGNGLKLGIYFSVLIKNLRSNTHAFIWAVESVQNEAIMHERHEKRSTIKALSGSFVGWMLCSMADFNWSKMFWISFSPGPRVHFAFFSDIMIKLLPST